MPWLRCEAEKVPKWWRARCRTSALTHKALLKKPCPVGHAAADACLKHAWVKAWAQPNKLVFWGCSTAAERAATQQSLQRAFERQPPAPFWRAAATRAQADAA
eukprot:3492694-Alexandrium_andersonii.AAC.1